MASIFICYRRKDVPVHAARLHGDLKRVFGADRVFMDTAAIAPGLDFRDAIRQTLERIEVMVVLGPAWNEPAKSDERPLSNPNDYVQLEVGSALSRNLRVIPVLMAGGDLPADDALPEELKALQFRQALRFSDNPAYWDFDVERLIAAIRNASEPRRQDAAPNASLNPTPLKPNPISARQQPIEDRPTEDESSAVSQDTSKGVERPAVVSEGRTESREPTANQKQPTRRKTTGLGVTTFFATALVILWLLGLVSGYTLGNFIYVLLVVGVVLLVITRLLRVLKRKSPHPPDAM